MRIALATGVAIFALAVAVGCGGSKKEANEPDGEGGWLKDSEPEYAPADDTLVPPEKYDEINNVLQRRGPHVERCFGKVLEEGGLPKSAKGTVVLQLTVQTDGAATDVKVLPSSTLKNEELYDCVRAEIHDARFPTLPKPVQTSYTYMFDRDY